MNAPTQQATSLSGRLKLLDTDPLGSPDLLLKSEFPPSYNPSQHLRNSGSKKSSGNKDSNLLFSASKEKDKLSYQAP